MTGVFLNEKFEFWQIDEMTIVSLIENYLFRKKLLDMTELY